MLLKKQLSMKELEKNLNVFQPTVVGIILCLEQKRVVESYSHASDKRIKLVRITGAGMERVADKFSEKGCKNNLKKVKGLQFLVRIIYETGN